MAENFDLIFGQNASQQYAWNDTDYQNGWETIGNIPPTAAQFDALQRRADMKSQELNSRLITVEASIAGGAGQKREADTTYAVGDVVSYDGLPMDWVLACIVGGTSGSADITLPSPRVEGARILDGTVTWALRKIATYGGIGYRQSSTACPTGSIAFSTALPAGWYLEATTGGTTSASDLVITSPSIGDTVTDGTVVWTIKKVGTDPNALTREITPAFNVRDVITTSGTYTAPVTGWYKVTCIGGGGAGGNGGNTTNGGLSGTQGGTTTFGTYCTAEGGHSGGGGGAVGSGGGGAAGEVATAYVQLDANDTIAYTIGAGGVAPSSGTSGSAVGASGSGGATGGVNSGGGQGAISVYGSGNNGSSYILGESSDFYGNVPTGIGGSNGTIYGGGGGGGVTNHQIPITAYSAVGGGNGGAGATITVRDSTYPKGGDGGNGAIIIEYFANL